MSCSATTKNGRPCSRTPLAGMRVCKQHDQPGRPAKLTDDAIAAAARFLERGGPQSELAARLKIGRTTWHRWLREGEAAFEEGLDTQQAKLHQAVRAAQADVQERCLSAILVAGHGRINPDTRQPEKGDWKALAWFLERRFPTDFGAIQRVDATIRDTSALPREPVDVEPPLSTDEFAAQLKDALRTRLHPEEDTP